MLENRRPKEALPYANQRSDWHSTCDEKEENDNRWNHSVNVTGRDNRDNTLMIWLVSIVMQPLVQRREYRHGKNREQRSQEDRDKQPQEHGWLFFSH